MANFLSVLWGYSAEVIPALLLGFFLSGIIHEFVPAEWVKKHLGTKGIMPVFYSTLTGTLLPICCWGSLPVAVSFYRKGSRLGPTLAFLVATPATSVSALLVTYRLLGLAFAVYIFFSVILMGMVIGLLGNFFKNEPKAPIKEVCPHCDIELEHCEHKNPLGYRGITARIKSILKFAFWDMPKDLGLQILIGLVIAAVVASFLPVGQIIRMYLSGPLAYLFSVIVGLLMYFCSTASVPFIDALIKQGMNVGAGFALLVIGPITSFGTILVLGKEFGIKVLLFFLTSICVLAVALGYIFSLIR